MEERDMSREESHQSPSPETTEPTDAELRQKWRDAQAIARSMGGMIGEGRPFRIVTGDPNALVPHSLPIVTATWEPPCMSCHQPIGYTAPEGRYVGATECKDCRSGSTARRLAMSGISRIEIDQPLADLKPTGPDGRRLSDFDAWMRYLCAFAQLAHNARIDPPFAFVCGNNGVGKSAGAQRALRDAILNGCRGRFVRLSSMLREIYSTYDTDERTDDRILTYTGVHLLVIDDVGQEDATNHAMGIFFDIVDERWRNARPTIFTSNYLPQADSLGAHISSRSDDDTRMKGIIDRITGGSRGNLFVIRGKSWRGSEAR